MRNKLIDAVIALAFVILFLCICIKAYPLDVVGLDAIKEYNKSISNNVDMDIIAEIESGNNPDAISYRGERFGRGLYQVSEICLREYNSYNRLNFEPSCLFDSDICYRVANWYMNTRIKQMLKGDDSVRNRLICYNWGYGNFRKWQRGERELPKETREYIEKYNKLKGVEL